AQLLERLKAQGIATTLERATQAAALLKERATFVDDMLEGTYLFVPGSPLKGNAAAEEELKKRWKPEVAPALEAYISALSGLPSFTPADLDAAFNAVLQAHGLKVGQLMPIHRLFVAGRMQGPGMFDVSVLLGREEVVARLKAGLEHCAAWA
ncbi:MAG: hypothetical protein KF797_08270, partial [Flavobacteriales bacterium]|nr:hypothetical protein [Flavobacteriales bacterium]